MNKQEIIWLINYLFEKRIKGQIKVDFNGTDQRADVCFTNVSISELSKLKREDIKELKIIKI